MKAIIMEIAEWIRDIKDAKQLNSAWCKFYGGEGEYLGECDARAALCYLLDDMRMIDLHKDEAGGSVPVDISGLHQIKLYVG